MFSRASSGRKAILPKVLRIRNRVYPSNTYVVITESPGKCLLIDPGLDQLEIQAYLEEHHLCPMAVLCTHGHFDHLGSAAFFQNQYCAELYLHTLDVKTAAASNFLMMVCKIGKRIAIPTADHLVEMEMALCIDGLEVKFHHTPGHTPGSCFIECDGIFFTGDTLYASAMGLVNLPGEDQTLLRKSLKRMLETMPEGSLICPGHGEEARLGQIIKHNKPLIDFLADDRWNSPGDTE